MPAQQERYKSSNIYELGSSAVSKINTLCKTNFPNFCKKYNFSELFKKERTNLNEPKKKKEPK